MIKDILKYLLIGCLTAIGGMFAAQISGSIFSGMSFDSAAVLGICMYLCIVIVICTGYIICKINSIQTSKDQKNKKEN